MGFWFLDDLNDPIAGVLPLGVPWFGALGAVTLSLYGVFDHNRVGHHNERPGHDDAGIGGSVETVTVTNSGTGDLHIYLPAQLPGHGPVGRE